MAPQVDPMPGPNGQEARARSRAGSESLGHRTERRHVRGHQKAEAANAEAQIETPPPPPRCLPPSVSPPPSLWVGPPALVSHRVQGSPWFARALRCRIPTPAAASLSDGVTSRLSRLLFLLAPLASVRHAAQASLRQKLRPEGPVSRTCCFGRNVRENVLGRCMDRCLRSRSPKHKLALCCHEFQWRAWLGRRLESQRGCRRGATLVCHRAIRLAAEVGGRMPLIASKVRERWT